MASRCVAPPGRTRSGPFHRRIVEIGLFFGDGDAVRLARPCAQIDQSAALGAEWAVAALRSPLDGRAAIRAGDRARAVHPSLTARSLEAAPRLVYVPLGQTRAQNAIEKCCCPRFCTSLLLVRSDRSSTHCGPRADRFAVVRTLSTVRRKHSVTVGSMEFRVGSFPSGDHWPASLVCDVGRGPCLPLRHLPLTAQLARVTLKLRQSRCL